MTIPGPFGAETPDEVLIAYVNDRLSPAERVEVERWLGEHPEWRARLGSYSAIGRAVRHGGATQSAAPDIGALGGLWAAIDAEQPAPASRVAASSHLPPPSLATAPPPPPSSGNVVSLDSRRRRSGWLLGAAAAGVLVVGGAVVVSQGDGGGDTNSAVDQPDATEGGLPEAPAPGDEPGPGDSGEDDNEDTGGAVPPPNEVVPDPTFGESDQAVGDGDVANQTERMAEVVDAIDATRAAGTARITAQSVTTLDVTGTRWEDDDGSEANVYGDAIGVVDFATGSSLDIELTNSDGRLWPDGPETPRVVQLLDGTTYVDCGDGYVLVSPDESGCAFGVGMSPIGLFDVLGVLAAGDGEVIRRGPDPDGLTGYLIETELTIAGEQRAVEVHVYVDPADGLIDFVKVYNPGDDVIPVNAGGAEGEPILVDATTLWVNFELTGHGDPVELPTVD